MESLDLLLKEYSYHSDKAIGEIAFNMYLVYRHQRKAFLLVLYGKKSDRYQSICADRLANAMGLLRVDISSRLYLYAHDVINISSDSELGNVLGYYGAGHDYSNSTLKRVGVTVKELSSNTEIMAEYMEYDKVSMPNVISFYHNRITRWTEVLREICPSFTVQYKYNIEQSILDIIYAMHNNDIEYIWHERERIINDLWNVDKLTDEVSTNLSNRCLFDYKFYKIKKIYLRSSSLLIE